MKKLKLAIGLFAMLTIAGCTTPVQVTHPDGTVTTEHQPDPKLKEVTDTVGAIGAIIPPPWGWITSTGAAAVLAVSQTLARRKNRLAAEAATTTAEKWEDVATTIIQGVEAAGDAATKVKEAIAVRAKSDGNHLEVAEAVRKELAP